MSEVKCDDRQRLIRSDPPLPDKALLVRSLFGEYPDGKTHARDALVADAIVNFDAFGYYGLSLWGIADAWPIEAVLEQSAGSLRVFGPGAEELVARFLGAAYTVVENFYFVATRTDRGD